VVAELLGVARAAVEDRVHLWKLGADTRARIGSVATLRSEHLRDFFLGDGLRVGPTARCVGLLDAQEALALGRGALLGGSAFLGTLSLGGRTFLRALFLAVRGGLNLGLGLESHLGVTTRIEAGLV